MELEALQEVYGQVQELGGSIIAISPQLNKYTKQVVKKHNLTFPVLEDKDNTYADKLHLVFPLPEKLKEVYNGFGIDLERFNGNDSWKLPMSGRFIIDSTGVIRNTEVHPDHTVRPEPTEIVEIMKSLV
ncbi:redoxin domain-containing protein [Desulfopila sp. IMCC35008]|uniref:redoxin domain-containing protein n=1 Tax=Desulfopila sp. IMCC35008 TaxID=2653858 RepID=UPI0013D1EE98|nr:redoxin domain-containing protein [Desulfopila sp. IMCC35008]